MKRNVLKSSIFSGVLALLFCFPQIKDTSLADITKPYLGEYQCEPALYGEQDYLDEFSYIRLELKGDDTFILYGKPKDGEKWERRGRYQYDKEKQTITLCIGDNGNGGITHSFPFQDGTLHIYFPVHGKLVNVTFKRR